MIVVLGLLLLRLTAADPTFEDLIQKDLKDLRMSAGVSFANGGELAKIGRDFATAYKFDSMNVVYKSPSKLRLEGQYKNAKIIYILNGTQKHILAPSVKQKWSESTAQAPGKRQSMLDFGVVDAGVADFMKGKFVRTDRETGEWIFDLTYQYWDDTSRHRVWVDSRTKVITKRQWFGQEGNLKATFLYGNVKQFANGVYLPTTAEVRNVEGKKAGVTAYKDVQVNKGGIADSQFVP